MKTEVRMVVYFNWDLHTNIKIGRKRNNPNLTKMPTMMNLGGLFTLNTIVIFISCKNAGYTARSMVKKHCPTIDT